MCQPFEQTTRSLSDGPAIVTRTPIKAGQGQWFKRPTSWVGGISVVALFMMVLPTLRVGRPIADDYCGYITLANSNFISFAWDTYLNWMANLVGYGIYGFLMQITLFWPMNLAYLPYIFGTFALLGLTSWEIVRYLISQGDGDRQAVDRHRQATWLIPVISVLFLIALFVTSVTGSLDILTISLFVVSYGVFHVWAVLASLSLLFFCATKSKNSYHPLSLMLVSLLAFLIGLLGVMEALVFIVAGGVLGVLALLRGGIRNWRAWTKTKPAALVIGVTLAGFTWVASPGVWRRRESISQDQPGDLRDFPVYAVSFVQDSLARALGNSSLLQAGLLAAVVGFVFVEFGKRLNRLAKTALWVGGSLPAVAIIVALGEFIGYPAWYHEIILSVLAVVLAILVGLLVGAALPRPNTPALGKNKTPLVSVHLIDSVAVVAFGALTLIGVATFLSRVEYLQDRAARWDSGFFTTIVDPLDGSLILPDGDSGILWVANCARDFAKLRNLEFRNYSPPMN